MTGGRNDEERELVEENEREKEYLKLRGMEMRLVVVGKGGKRAK